VFSGHTIKPLGSCTKVFETTKSFGEQNSFHHIDSFGLIDRDRRTDEEISDINNPNIWVAEVAEVENFLLLEEIIKVVASKMMKNPEEVFEAVKNNVIEFFKTQIDYQAVQHTISRIELIFKNATNYNSIKEFKDLEKSLSNFWKSQDFKKIYGEIKSSFDKLIETNDYDGIIKVFNNKGLLSNSNVVGLCDLNPRNNAYLNFILSILKQKSGCSNRIKKAIIEKIKIQSQLINCCT